MLQRSLRHRAPVLWLLLPLMGGLIAARLGLGGSGGGHHASAAWLLGLAFVFMAGACFLRKHPWLWGVGFCASMILASAVYFHLRDDRLAAWDELPPREVRLTLEITRTFSAGKNPALLSGLAVIESADSRAPELLGRRVYFSLFNPKGGRPIRTAQIRVRGVLQSVSLHAATTTFDGYLINAGINLRLEQGRVLASVREPTRYAQFCEAGRKRIADLLGWGLEKHLDFANGSRALFLGEVTELGAERKQRYIETGTLHFFAIDGLHIAAVAVALHLILGLLRCPRLGLFLGLSTLLWLYADITGRSPSAVRAVVTVVFFEGAFMLKRPINPIASLGASALISLLIAPSELFGASLQMSYGIVASLLLLGLPLAETWQERWSPFRQLPKLSWRWWQHAWYHVYRAIIGTLAIGLSTALLSDLCGVMFFQLYAPSALLANFLLIPVASCGLWANFIAVVTGLLGLRWPTSVFNHAAAVALWLMERCIHVLVTLPGAVFHWSFRSPTFGFVAIGALLSALLYGYATRWEWRRGGWLPPFVVTAIALLCCVNIDK